jgi:thiol-disulfide isomerase/thioredoxin
MVYQINASSFVMNSTSKLLKLKNKTGKKGMLLIYADWCGYCTRFKPDYKKLDSILKEKGILFPLFAIEDSSIEASKQLGPALNFTGYPTLKVVMENGELVNYTGNRDLESLLKFVSQ